MNFIGSILAQFLSWLVSLGMLVIPMGGVPQNVDYRSIANPSGQVQIAEKSTGLRTLDETTRAGALAMLRTLVGSINNREIDRSVMTKAIEAMPIRGENDNDGRTSSDNGVVPPLLKGIRDYQLFLMPTKDPNVYEFAATYAQANGKQMQTKTGITYNAKTGETTTSVFTSNFGTKRNINLKDIVFYNEAATWQQSFGFNAVYDMLSPMLLYDLDHLRIKFPYGGKDWMFQFWKGSYTVVSNGAEIGIYEKPQSRKVAHYDCSDLMVPMEMSMYHGDRLMFTQGMDKTWWLTAFQPGLKIKPRELTLVSSITFNDAKMRKLFVEELRTQDSVSKISEKGATVRFSWK